MVLVVATVDYHAAVASQADDTSTVTAPVISTNYWNSSGGNGTDEDVDAACFTALAAVGLEYKRAHGYVVMVVCVVGILANLANIVVLTRKKMRSAVNALLTALAAAELTLMCLYLPIGAYYYVLGGSRWPTLGFFRSDPRSLRYALLYSTLSVMCHAIAVWMTTAVATFRYVRLRFPVRGRAWCTMRSAGIVTCVVVAAAAVLTAPNWVVNDIVTADDVRLHRFPYCVPLYERRNDSGPDSRNGTTVRDVGRGNIMVDGGDGDSDGRLPSTGQGLYTIHLSQFARENPLVSEVNYYVQAVFVRFLPTASLTLLTVLLVCIMWTAEQRHRALMSGSKAAVATTSAVGARGRGGAGGGISDESRSGEQQQQQRQHHRTTRMLLAAVALVLSVEVPHGILIILLLADASFRDTYDALGDLIDMATLLSQSLNFFLYTAMSTQFRHTFFALFWSKWADRLEHDWSLLAAAAAATAGTRRSVAGRRGGSTGGGGEGFVSRSLDGSQQPLSSMSACCRSLDDWGDGRSGRATAIGKVAAAGALAPAAAGRACSLSTDEFAECSALLLPPTSPRRCASGPPGLCGAVSRGSLTNGRAKGDSN